MKIRKAFEMWAESQGWNIDRCDTGEYRTQTTDAAYGGWIARAGESENTLGSGLVGNECNCDKYHACFYCYGKKSEHMSRDDKSNYYDAGGVETLDIIKAKLTPEQYEGYLLGNVLKYTCRMMHKETPIRDAEKAANYARWLHESMK